jgi:hypothetical protein
MVVMRVVICLSALVAFACGGATRDFTGGESAQPSAGASGAGLVTMSRELGGAGGSTGGAQAVTGGAPVAAGSGGAEPVVATGGAPAAGAASLATGGVVEADGQPTGGSAGSSAAGASTGGVATRECGKDQTLCGGDTCVSFVASGLYSDPQNCGACGVVCDPDEVCKWLGSPRPGGYQCTLPCAEGETFCGGTTCVGFAVTGLYSDPKNCGACGRECPEGQMCGAWTGAKGRYYDCVP